MNYENLSVAELRSLVREKGIATGTPVVMAKKEELVGWLNGELLPLATPAPQPKPAPAQGDQLADVLAAALQGRISAGVDAEAVKAIIKEYTASPEFAQAVRQHAPGVTYTKIELAAAPTITLQEKTHKALPKVLRAINAGLPVLLVGPSGTGKTHLASQVAKALGRDFTYNSMSAGCSESHIIGRTLPDASGNWTYKPSQFVTTYQNGGLHLFDEIDAADPNLLVLINAALSNSHLSVPFLDKPIERHPKASIIAAANTYGTGASRQYCGRNALDAATLNRFAMATIEIGYDEDLEAGILADMLDEATAQSWLKAGLKIRRAIEQYNLRRIFSTRNFIDGAKLILAGMPQDDILDGYFLAWTADERAKI